MKIVWSFSSQQGDVPVDDEVLKRPFVLRLRPLQLHPVLSLEDFFSAMETAVLKEGGRQLALILSRIWKKDVNPGDIERLLFRYEKYGTLYQIVSIEVFSGTLRVKLSGNVALLPEARATLQREAALLEQLNRRYGYPYLPRVYMLDSVDIRRRDFVQRMDVLLSQWFEDFHEWHFCGDKDQADSILIWDLEAGYRRASQGERHEIIRAASRILTLYFDPETYAQILPWHHGGGDFVVRSERVGIQVRLVTARGYQPLIGSAAKEGLSPPEALLLFFLDMTVRMRLDKFEGLGEAVWASDGILPSVILGFLEGLKQMKGEGRIAGDLVDRVVRMLSSLRKEDLYGRFERLMEIYRARDPGDFPCIKRNLEGHTRELHRYLESRVMEWVRRPEFGLNQD
ncbi:MAG: hypothetical protein JRJ78_02635 [Deltaproteobacteria bacterium]|nr:hypothetical protein [Deltaproteobacteria bacterium]